jgi:hypothetical protein
MSEQTKWDGQSKAQVLGFKIFVFILNTFGLNPAYFLLRFVSFHYFLFSKPNKYIKEYFQTVHGPNGSLQKQFYFRSNHH